MVKNSVVGTNAALSQSGSLATNDWMSGKTTTSRYNALNKTSRSKGAQGYNIKSFAKTSMDKIQQAAAKVGLSVMPSISEDGSLLHLGFVPKTMERSVIGKDGMVDFSKTGHIAIPIGNADGTMKINGAAKADFFTSVLDGDDFVGTTLSDAYFKQFAEHFERMNLKELNPREITRRLGRAYQDIYGDSTGLNTYVDSDEMLKGTTMGDNSAANFNKSSGFNSNPLIQGLKSNKYFKQATNGITEDAINSTLHDLVTAASSGSDEDYESFIHNNGWLNKLYGSNGSPGNARSLLQNLRQRMQPYGLTSKDRRDDPYNAGIYSTSLSHIFKPFMREYGSGAGGRYGEQSIKDIAKTDEASKAFDDALEQSRGLSINKVVDGLANELGVSYRNAQLYNMLEVTDEELAAAHKALGRKGHAPSVFGGGLGLRSDLFNTLESERAIPTSVTADELFSSEFAEMFTKKDLAALKAMKNGDRYENTIENQTLARNYRVGGSQLHTGTKIKGITYSGGKYTIDAVEKIAASEGEKYLTGLGLRGTLAPGDAGIDDAFIEEVLKAKIANGTANYTGEDIKNLIPQISGFMSAEDLSQTKYQSGKVLDRIQYALNGALNEGMTEKDFTKKMNRMSKNGDLGNALSKYFSFQNGNIITSGDFDNILKEVTGGDVDKIRKAEEMLFNSNFTTKGSLSNLLLDFVGKNSPLAVGIKAGLLSTSLNKADTASYNDITANEKYSRVKAGARERDIMRRTGRNIAAGAGNNADAVNAYFSAVDEMFSPENLEAAENEIERMKKVSNSTMASGTKGDVRGDTYLSESESSRAVLDAGKLTTTEYNLAMRNKRAKTAHSSYMMTEEEYQNSIFGHLDRARENVYSQGGILDKNSIAMSAKLAGRVDMGDGYGVNELFLSALPERIENADGSVGYRLSQEQIAFERAVKISHRDTTGKNVEKVKEAVGDLLNAQNASYMYKNGELFKQRNERVQAGAGFL